MQSSFRHLLRLRTEKLSFNSSVQRVRPTALPCLYQSSSLTKLPSIYIFILVGGWAALEEGEEGNNVKKVAHFHELFDSKVPDEKLLTCTIFHLFTARRRSNL